MSTPTAIEVVRAQNDWWLTHNSFMPPHTRSEYAAAIASVLADAERFKALATRTYGSDHIIGISRRKDDHILVWGEGKTLAELADQLRSNNPHVSS